MFICSAYLQSVSQGAWTFTNMMSLFVKEGFQRKKKHGSLRTKLRNQANKSPLKTKLKFSLPPSPALDPQPVNSSQRCTSFPPVGWTSCKPGCSQYASSHLGKTAQRNRHDSFSAATMFHLWILDAGMLNRGQLILEASLWFIVKITTV